MGLYHPCKILEVVKKDKEVVSSDESIQLIVEAWDELQWAVSLDQRLLNEKVLSGDVVLVDWTIDEQTKNPKMNAVKILKGKKGDNVWKSYKDYLKKQKVKVNTMHEKNQAAAAASYMG
ncbi:MAG TPA: hypothetical protein VJB06_03785 [archaeon]|nr:hypothetical protein [archaeon]